VGGAHARRGNRGQEIGSYEEERGGTRMNTWNGSEHPSLRSIADCNLEEDPETITSTP
jgi:hypothetical protein